MGALIGDLKLFFNGLRLIWNLFKKDHDMDDLSENLEVVAIASSRENR